MKKISKAFKIFLSEIIGDFMLFVCVIAPILMGIAFRVLLAIAEELLCEHFRVSSILTPYYVLFDLLLALMTPIMFSFAGVLFILEEMDNSIAKYLFVTPLGQSGYFASRIGLPTIIAVFYDIVLLIILNSSGLLMPMIIVISIGGGLMAVISSLIIITFAKNKMEGMALIKLVGLLIMGIPGAYFIKGPTQYTMGFSPSFWLAKLNLTKQYIYAIPTVITSGIIILFLVKKFKVKKMS